jgi:membrane-associated phospholipid phosphatase
MPLVTLISHHAIAFVFGVFLLFVLVVTAVLLLGRFVWKRRAPIWQVVSRGFRLLGLLPPFAWLQRRFPNVFAFLGHRLTPREFLGIYLTSGLLLSLGVMLFVILSQRIVGTTELVAFDHQLAKALQETMIPRTFATLSRLTILGNGEVLTVIGLGLAALLALRRERTLLVGWIVALGGGGVLNQALKAIFHRVRPEYATVSGWSFPSGHAMGSFITYGMLAYLALIFFPRRAAHLTAACLLLLVLFIGFSRLYLGVHYFSDVIAGYSAAVVWLSICVSGTEIVRLRTVKRRKQASLGSEAAPTLRAAE